MLRTLVSGDVRMRPYSISASKNGPVASPAGFHHVAVASAATATNAPPRPSARPPTVSYICARADRGTRSATEDTRHTTTRRITFYIVGRVGLCPVRGVFQPTRTEAATTGDASPFVCRE